LSDIDDPQLRLKLLHLCAALPRVDALVDEGESIVLGAAVE
jgi:hypothetical protein